MTNPSHAATHPPSKRLIIGVLAIYATLICLRMPHIILTGRFWAEEGTVFFHNAAVLPPLTALFNSYGGYLNIIANGATLLAYTLLPLTLAPYATIATGLVFQLLPPFLILTARDNWLQPLTIRLSAVALLLLTPSSSEIWLQVLHCQFELALSCALILALDPVAGGIGRVRLVVLFLAPLAGPGAIVFTVLFLLRTLIDRTRARCLQFLVLTAASSLQIFFFYHTQAFRGANHWFLPALAVVLCREPLQGLLGINFLTKGIIHDIRQSFDAHASGVIWTGVITIVFFGLCFATSLLKSRFRVCLWLLLANAVFTGAALYGAIGGPLPELDTFNGERYIFVGQSLFLLMVLAFVAALQKRTRRFPHPLILWLLVLGLKPYLYPNYNHNGPSWRQEVTKWQSDHSYKLQIWPENWTMSLP